MSRQNDSGIKSLAVRRDFWLEIFLQILRDQSNAIGHDHVYAVLSLFLYSIGSANSMQSLSGALTFTLSGSLFKGPYESQVRPRRLIYWMILGQRISISEATKIPPRSQRLANRIASCRVQVRLSLSVMALPTLAMSITEYTYCLIERRTQISGVEDDRTMARLPANFVGLVEDRIDERVDLDSHGLHWHFSLGEGSGTPVVIRIDSAGAAQIH